MNKPIGLALEWWLKKQDKWGSVSTKEGEIISGDEKSIIIKGDGTFSISKWSVSGVPQPTEDELIQIVSDYEAYLVK